MCGDVGTVSEEVVVSGGRGAADTSDVNVVRPAANWDTAFGLSGSHAAAIRLRATVVP
jgi:hypothetical protein